MSKFGVGDAVSAFGLSGYVIDTFRDGDVEVEFPNNKLLFKSDGKLSDWHKEPTLHLIEKAKKQVNVRIESFDDLIHYDMLGEIKYPFNFDIFKK